MRTSVPSERVVVRSAPLTLRSAWPVAVLAAGDAVSFLVFAGVGRRSHSETSGLGALGSVVVTAFPFALGWFLVSPFAGAFKRALLDNPGRMLKRTEIAWLCAWPVTLLLRWALSTDHQIPVSFAIVILLSNAVFLGIWRGAFAVLARIRR